MSLLPKVALALDPGEFRPITVLPVMLKMSARAWMVAARLYLALQRRSSHGFRPTFQCSEVHWSLRSLLERRREWGLATCLCKVDIRKAYDTVSFAGINALFETRQLPGWMRRAYWRLHLGRVLRFRTSDGAIEFESGVRRGMPQGSQDRVERCRTPS